MIVVHYLCTNDRARCTFTVCIDLRFILSTFYILYIKFVILYRGVDVVRKMGGQDF